MRSWRLAALVLGLALVIAGCGGTTEGSPQPTEESPEETHEQADDDLPHSGAPAVEGPIDPGGFLEQPCEAIDAELLNESGFDIGEAESEPDAAMGPRCNYPFATFEQGIAGGSFITASDEGVSALYAQRDELSLFEELEAIDGHPVVARSAADGRNDGRCVVSVGLRDDLAYNMGVVATNEESPYHDDPCGAAHELAGLAVETMSEGAGE